MNLSKLCLIGVVLGTVALLTIGKTQAQTWRAAGSAAEAVEEDHSAVEQVSWDQRVLRRPQQPLQWRQPQHMAPAGGYRMARRSLGPDEVFEATASPVEPAGPAPLATDAEVIPPGQPQQRFEPLADDGVFAEAGCCGNVCDPCGCPPCGDCCDLGWEVFDGRCGQWLRGLSVFAGADGFKGPMDRGALGNGNFGLNEGVNMARPLGDPWGCGYQIGVNFVQSNFSSDKDPQTGLRELPFRRQYFATAGIFRRADPCCGGFQWGVAYDYLHDVYYQDSNLQQIRSELGFVFDQCNEIGFYGAYGIGGDQIHEGRQLVGRLDPTDMFTMYYRRQFEQGGNGRLFAGATAHGDGLLGADLWVPLGRGFAVENRVTYLIPNGKITGQRDNPSQQRESWGLVLQLVWYPGQNALCQRENPYRAMFGVADNSTFMVDSLTP